MSVRYICPVSVSGSHDLNLKFAESGDKHQYNPTQRDTLFSKWVHCNYENVHIWNLQ
jgi:hypothetical protein